MEEANRLLVESREKIEQQNQQLSDYEAEINLLRRRLETLETDREKDKKQIATLQDALNRARIVSKPSRQLASCLIYSYALVEYINRFAVDRMVTLFFTMLPSVKFAEEKVPDFFILREKNAKISATLSLT